MAKRRVSRDEAAGIVGRIQNLTKRGHTNAEACKALGIAPATYYRYRKIAGVDIQPALRKDWNQIANVWQHPLLERLSPTEARNLRYNIADAVRGCFSVPAAIPDIDICAELCRLDKALKALLATYDSLGRDARGLVIDLRAANIRTPDFASTIEQLRSLEVEISLVADGLVKNVKERKKHRRLPNRSSRIRNLAAALATLFARHFGKQPLHIFDAYSDEPQPSSEFNLFVRSVFDHFLPELAVGPHALNAAMQQAAARIHYCDDKELPG